MYRRKSGESVSGSFHSSGEGNGEEGDRLKMVREVQGLLLLSEKRNRMEIEKCLHFMGNVYLSRHTWAFVSGRWIINGGLCGGPGT